MPCDIVWANDTDTLPASWLAARLRRKALVMDSHEIFPEVPELVGRNRVKRVWERIERMPDSFFDGIGEMDITYIITVSKCVDTDKSDAVGNLDVGNLGNNLVHANPTAAVFHKRVGQLCALFDYHIYLRCGPERIYGAFQRSLIKLYLHIFINFIQCQ